MKKIFKISVFCAAAVAAVSGVASFCYCQNNCISVSKYRYKNSKLPKEFDGFLLAHISDLHNKMFGENQKNILSKLAKISPDAIVITGDLIDSRRYDLKTAMTFINGAVKIAPVYYVSGNHEAKSNKFEDIKNALIAAGVSVLENEHTTITKQGKHIYIIGATDPIFFKKNFVGEKSCEKTKQYLKGWQSNAQFKILISHRPELFDIYVENNIELIFSGHAHGGQIRLPFVGGLYVPNQGILPKYSEGKHTKKQSTMFISRGLGNSLFPLRVFNRPQIITVKLSSKDKRK